MNSIDIKQENWMNTKWRPMMGWCYMITCITDFIIFPVLWSIMQAYNQGHVSNQWNPLTLQGAGLFHVAMGAILGVTAWSRGQEKIAGVSSNIVQPQVRIGFGGRPAPIPEEQPIR
jgi:hypothetical protein